VYAVWIAPGISRRMACRGAIGYRTVIRRGGSVLRMSTVALVAVLIGAIRCFVHVSESPALLVRPRAPRKIKLSKFCCVGSAVGGPSAVISLDSRGRLSHIQSTASVGNTRQDQIEQVLQCGTAALL